MSVLGLAAMLAAAPVLGVAAEIAARGLIRRFGGYYRHVPYAHTRYVIDREALPDLPPIARSDINADGERGGPAPRPGERVYRVLVVGGSAAECALLDQAQTWGGVVERILSEPETARALDPTSPDLRVHVGNAARAILPCRELDLLLRKILPRYANIDLVIVMVGAADVVSWIERGMPREIDESPRPLDKIFEQHPEGPWGFAPRQTALWRVLGGLRRRIRERVVSEAGGDWLHRVRRMRAAAERMIDEVPDATPMLDHFEAQLTALLETARGRATRVMLVRQPWRNDVPAEDQPLLWNFGLGRPYREDVKAYFTTPVVDALMRMIDARAVAVADRLGVEHVDLMPHLEQSRAVFYDELHFTPRGAEVVGRIVAEAVLRVGR